MANLLKWGKDRLNQAQGVYHQLNPLDNGRTYDTNQRGVRPGTPNPNRPQNNSPGFQLSNNSLTRGFSRVVDQVNPMDDNRTWKQHAPVGQYRRGAFNQLVNGGVVGTFTQPVIKFGNTANLGARQAVEGGKMLLADVTNNSEAGLAASRRADQNYARFAKPDAGAFSGGTFFKSPEEAARGDFKTIASRVGGGTLETAATVVPFARGGTLFKAGMNAKQAIPRLAIEGAGYNTAFSAGDQLINEGRVTPEVLIKSAAAGAVLGPGGYLAGRGAKAIPGAVRQASPNAIAARHPAVQELNSTLTRLNDQRGQMLAGGMPETHPAVKANAKAYQMALNERNNTMKAVTEGGYLQMPGKKQVNDPLYHGTSPEAAAKIRAEGFDVNAPKSSELPGMPANYPGSTFVTHSKEQAAAYSNRTPTAKLLKYKAEAAIDHGVKTGDNGFIQEVMDHPAIAKVLNKKTFNVQGTKMTVPEMLDAGATLQDVAPLIKQAIPDAQKLIQRKDGIVLKTALPKDAKVFTISDRDGRDYAKLVKDAGGKEKIKDYLQRKGYVGLKDELNNDLAVFDQSKLSVNKKKPNPRDFRSATTKQSVGEYYDQFKGTNSHADFVKEGQRFDKMVADAKSGKNIIAQAENDQYRIHITKEPGGIANKPSILVENKKTGEFVREMNWMNDPEAAFKLTPEQWDKLPIEKRAEMEAKFKLDNFYKDDASFNAFKNSTEFNKNLAQVASEDKNHFGLKKLGEGGYAKVPGKEPKPSKALLKDNLPDSFTGQPSPRGKTAAKSQGQRQVLSKATDLPDLKSSTLEPPHPLNVSKFNVSKKAKKALSEVQENLKAEIESTRGERLTNKEVREHMKANRAVLANPKNRDATKKYLASVLANRENNAALLKKRAGGNLTTAEAQKLNEGLLKQYAAAADAGRTLQAFRETADPNEQTVLDVMLKKIAENSDQLDEAIKASKKLGPNPTAKEQARFYRQFVKATKEDWLDKYRYTNMLSSPLTHIVNTASNMEGVLGVAPAQKLYEGGVDAAKHVLTFGKSKRTRYASEAGSYYKGVAKSFPEALHNFREVMSGRRITGNPDMDSLRNVPLATDGPLAVADHTLSFVPKLLEAGDQFATTLAKGGETAAIMKRASKGVKVDTSPEGILKLTDEAARYRVFRQEMGKKGQGHLLDAVDIPAKLIMELRNSKNPYVRTAAKFTVPFVATPTNLFKQGIEYSPLGVFTLHGNLDKTAQAAKMLMGTTAVATAVGALAAGGDITFGEPTNKDQRDAFRAEGKQAYSFKLPGSDKWINYSKFHPAVSMNLAIVGAVKDAADKGSITDSEAERILNTGAGIINYFTDQSYMKNVGDFVNILQGKDNTNAQTMVSSQAANTTNQVVPFKSLVSWVGRQIDSTQRKVDSKASTWEQTYQGIVKDIPGLNKDVPSRTNPYTGEPLKNPYPILNAWNPNRISKDQGFGNTTGLNVDQRELLRDLPIDRKEPFRRSVIESKAQAKLVKEEKQAVQDNRPAPFKSNVQPKDKGSADLKQLSDGTYYAKVGKEYKSFDTKEAAQEAQAKEQFKSSNEDLKQIGNKVYYKDSNGDIKSKSKPQYDYDNIDSKESLNMDRAKEDDDLDSWLSAAQKRYDAMETLKKSYNPKTEQSKIDDITNKQEDLKRQADKYQGYGGFTKPKTGRKKGSGARKGFQAPQGGGISASKTAMQASDLASSVGVKRAPRLRRKF